MHVVPRWVVVLFLCAQVAGAVRLKRVAEDEGASYGDQWLGNGGTGFDPWVFRSTNSATSGGAGAFLAGTNDASLNVIASEDGNKAWGTFANAPTGQQGIVAFRGFGWNGQRWANALDSTGDTFRVSMENENVDFGGGVGFVLRNGNVDYTANDFTTGARFAFAFIGGFVNYQIVLGTNDLVDSGIQHRNTGLELAFSLTSEDTYSLAIYDPFASNQFLTNLTGSLAHTGKIESVALYNIDSSTAPFNNTYFNFMSIDQNVLPPRPTVLLIR